MMITIRNNKGEIATCLVDEDDYEMASSYKWNLSNGYAKSKEGYLHRIIMGAKKGEIVDHINNNKLDDTKDNLRIVSRSQNAQNIPKKEGRSSKYTGVSFNKETNKWDSYIKINGVKNNYAFEQEKHAAWWYNKLALKYYGKDSKLNRLDEPDDFVEPVKLKRELPIGVILTKSGKYQSYLDYNKKRYYIGLFDTLEKASTARNNKKEELQSNDIKKIPEIKRNKDNVPIIIASSKEEILVDEDKYNDLNAYKWYINNHGYPTTTINGKNITMHRLLMTALDDEIIDHVNHNKTDCRMANLRKSTHALNNHNMKKRKNTSSKYIGVSLDKRRNTFTAEIRKNKKKYYLGSFETEEDAARAYNKKAAELYGEYANLNACIL